MKICIIPARGGSKRIPRKNIKSFLGKPIIAYSIQAAIESELFDEVMVSTDDEEIAEIAIKYGAKVPFLRSSENADDYATTSDVLTEVIDRYLNQNMKFNYVCCLYPCAPFVSSKTLIKAFEKLNSLNKSSIFPIVKFSSQIQRALIITNNELEFREKKFEKYRSQDLSLTYHDAGQFYFMKNSVILNNQSIVGNNTSYIIVDEMNVQDIDTINDWKIAELKYKLKTTL